MSTFIPAEWMPLVWRFAGSLAIVLVSLVLYRLAKRALTMAESQERLSTPVTAVLRLIVRWGLVAVTVLVLLNQYGVLRNAWTALAAVLAMVAVGFVAVWSVLSNTLCTLLLLIYQPFQIGDYIELPADNLSGKAVDLNMLFTTLREEDGSLVQVPNNFFFQKAIRRRVTPQGIALTEQLGRSEPAD
jgi:small-conductance mechanosensitive channel